ncbi:MAG: hypothetical protein Q9187_005504 [Circinaria calcarea]
MIPQRSNRRRPLSISSVSSDASDSFSRYSYKGLLESPLPSPSLPSILPRHGKKPPSIRFRPIIRLLLRLSLWLVGGGLFIWVVLTVISAARSRADFTHVSHDGAAYELIGGDTLPQEATPVVVVDRHGKSKWTVSIPPSHQFPLRPSTYSSICSESERISRHLAELKTHSALSVHRGHVNYYRVDHSFMDVAEAEEDGLLPGSKHVENIKNGETTADINKSAMSGQSDPKTAQQERTVCERSLTYVMETTNAGFGKTVMGLWLSYGLAQKEGRAFFVDDRHWAYGNYSTFFRPPPSPACLQPPDHHRLPCPHHARHLVVSASTVPWTFGRLFNEKFEDTRKVGVFRQGPIFALLRTGYEALFHLENSDGQYAETRTRDLDSQIRDKGGLVVGVHVRHGDRHPWEYQYQNSYIPLENYMDAAKALISDAFTAQIGSANNTNDSVSGIVLASDDPDVYASSDFSSAFHAQERILLASKSTLDAAKEPRQKAQSKFVDDSFGWEGGFFKDVFWGLGDRTASTTGRSLRLRAEQLEREERRLPSELALQLRALVGRAYLLDLAVVGRADRIVCGVSSTGCRLLAVMMGWERAVVQGGWRNVDGGFAWRGLMW